MEKNTEFSLVIPETKQTTVKAKIFDFIKDPYSKETIGTSEIERRMAEEGYKPATYSDLEALVNSGAELSMTLATGTMFEGERIPLVPGWNGYKYFVCSIFRGFGPSFYFLGIKNY